MQLKYRGIGYQAPETSINIEPMLNLETYRGVRFQAKQSHARAPQLGVKLTYRGVSYNV